MKNIVLLFAPFLLLAFVGADLKPVDTDDAVSFAIKNFGLNVNGKFKGLQGKIKWDAVNPSNSLFDVAVDVNTISTGIDSRDSHLKKEDYFDAEKYPAIHFISTAVTAGNVTGNLTIKGITKKISFPFTVTASGNGYVFMGSFALNRRDFGVGNGSAVLSDNVTVSLKVQANP